MVTNSRPSKQTIFRSTHNRNYTALSNRIAEDPSLSWQAKGLFWYLISRPTNWKVVEADVINHATNGRDATRRAIRELQSAGYLVRRPAKDQRGRITHWETMVFESPQFTEIPQTGEAVQITGNPHSGKPSDWETHILENQTLQSNDQLINEFKKNTHTKGQQNSADRIAPNGACVTQPSNEDLENPATSQDPAFEELTGVVSQNSATDQDSAGPQAQILHSATARSDKARSAATAKRDKATTTIKAKKGKNTPSKAETASEPIPAPLAARIEKFRAKVPLSFGKLADLLQGHPHELWTEALEAAEDAMRAVANLQNPAGFAIIFLSSWQPEPETPEKIWSREYKRLRALLQEKGLPAHVPNGGIPGVNLQPHAPFCKDLLPLEALRAVMAWAEAYEPPADEPPAAPPFNWRAHMGIA